MPAPRVHDEYVHVSPPLKKKKKKKKNVNFDLGASTSVNVYIDLLSRSTGENVPTDICMLLLHQDNMNTIDSIYILGDEAGDGPWLWVPATPAERGWWVQATLDDVVVPSSVQLVVPLSTGRGGERAGGYGSRSEESEPREMAAERRRVGWGRQQQRGEMAAETAVERESQGRWQQRERE